MKKGRFSKEEMELYRGECRGSFSPDHDSQPTQIEIHILIKNWIKEKIGFSSSQKKRSCCCQRVKR
jgi:hypothetical protein